MEIIKGPFKNTKNIILASKSPRRQYLLSLLGIHFEVCVSNVKEIMSGADPEELVLLNAKNKAQDILKKKINGVIIGADTAVVLDTEILGKPKNMKDAFNTLKKLMGKWHKVITGCYLIDNTNEQEQVEQFLVKSEVFLNKMNDYIVENYIKTKEPMDKAGSYAIQGAGAFLVKEIKGSYTNVVGLPLTEIVNSLLKLKAITV